MIFIETNKFAPTSRMSHRGFEPAVPLPSASQPKTSKPVQAIAACIMHPLIGKQRFINVLGNCVIMGFCNLHNCQQLFAIFAKNGTLRLQPRSIALALIIVLALASVALYKKHSKPLGSV